jgi:uncharacterized membrane protein YphA (DoxX/SURF4 family)
MLNEGLEKLLPPKGKPFTAEAYLRASSGPFSPYFRDIVPDVDSKELLRRDDSGRPAGLKDAWTRELGAMADHYGISDANREKAVAALKTASAAADEWFLNRENADKVQKYLDDLARVESIEQDPNALTSQRLLAQKERRALETTRKELVATLDGWTESLRKAWTEGENAAVSAEQLASAGPVPRERSTLDWVNLTTSWGLTLAGGGLLLGLLTPIAALAGAVLLAMFYLAMPPWPGLPVPPNVEGNYWIVNKNLIELLACLVIAATPNGLWIGLDALLFGWMGRRRDATGTPASGPSSPPGSNPAILPPTRPRGSTEPREPIPLSYGAKP